MLAGIFAVLGGLSLAAPWVAATVIAVFCGVTLLAAGIAQLAMAVGTYTWRGFQPCLDPLAVPGLEDLALSTVSLNDLCLEP